LSFALGRIKRIPATAPITVAKRKENTRMPIPISGFWEIILYNFSPYTQEEHEKAIHNISDCYGSEKNSHSSTEIGNASITILQIEAECNYKVYGKPQYYV
jgi:hypothetical protein